MNDHDPVDQARSEAGGTDDECVGCQRYSAGHVVHFIQARLAGESPWGWRDGVVTSISHRHLRIEYTFAAGTVRCWHHHDLSAELQVGDPVRVHEQYHLLDGPMGIVCVLCDGGLGAVPDPEHPDLSNHERDAIIVNVATGRGFSVSSPAAQPERRPPGA